MKSILWKIQENWYLMENLSSSFEGSVEGFDYFQKEEKRVTWNNRKISAESCGSLAHLLTRDCLPKVCSFRGKEPSLFDNYFDSEAKKKNKFDIAVYQYHIRCNNEVSKKHLEKSFEMMATGMVGVVVGVMAFMKDSKKGTYMLYLCAERVWKGVEEFKKAMETSNTPLDNVHFVTWYDDYEKNTRELTNNSILEAWEPLDTSGFELMDDQYKRKQLDPSLSNNIRDYA